MAFDPDLDLKRARFAEQVRAAVRQDTRRIIIVGARGWVGRTAIALLSEALGPACFAERVICVGSTAGLVEIGDQEVLQRSLSDLATLDPCPTLLLHLAFLTMDKFAEMHPDDYVRSNQVLSRAVLEALEPIGVDRLFVASSGAAAFADNPDAADNLRCYGRLKRDDETLFAGWGNAMPDRRRVAIARIYSVSGPHINKHQTYALANLILAALEGRPIEVHASKRVIRSYVAVRDLLSLVFAILLAPDADPIIQFDTGGEPCELGELATIIARTLGGEASRPPVTDSTENRYVGDPRSWSALLECYGIEPLALREQVLETAAHLARETPLEGHEAALGTTGCGA
jgi:nucleoside-diphosphate-sugar epimerase